MSTALVNFYGKFTFRTYLRYTKIEVLKNLGWCLTFGGLYILSVQCVPGLSQLSWFKIPHYMRRGVGGKISRIKHLWNFEFLKMWQVSRAQCWTKVCRGGLNWALVSFILRCCSLLFSKWNRAVFQSFSFFAFFCSWYILTLKVVQALPIYL